MLSSLLKEQTQEAHQALEAIVVRQIKAIRGKDQYAQLLQKFYGFHMPLEKLFDNHLNNSLIPQYDERRKASLLLQDMEKLGIATTQMEAAAALPAVDSVAKAFGSFYVLEGSTQGGAIVADMLIKYAGLSSDTTTFFSVYGDDKKKMWQSFKDAVDVYTGDNNFEKDAIAAANETFTTFREWMIK